MEIKYIWIQEYRKIIQNLDVNFYHNGKHRFSYKNNRVDLIEADPSLLDFGKNVTGVTAIAGQNGSGKSSVCEVLLNATATLVNGGFSFDFPFIGIVCYGDYIFYSNKVQLNNTEELAAVGYKVFQFDDTPLAKIPHELKPEFIKRGFIYYSNMLDWRSSLSLMNLVNISTEAYIQQDYRIATRPIPDIVEHHLSPNFIGSHYENEAYRNIKFYLNFPKNLPFAEPETLILRSSFSENNRHLNHRLDNTEIENVLRELENRILSDIFPEQLSPEIRDFNIAIETDQHRFRQVVIYLYRLNLLIIHCKTIGTFPPVENIADYVYHRMNIVNIFAMPEKIIQLLDIHEQLVKLGYFQKQFFPYYLRDKHKSNWKFYACEYLNITNGEIAISLLKDFIILEELISNHSAYMSKRISNFDLIPATSSGEHSFLSLFSRLYDVIQRYDKGMDNRESIVLILDEADVGFHPAWQKKFLQWLIDFLNDDFNGYTFQIILTTHSPYLLSDLSSEHIVLLKKVDGETKVIPPMEFQTFGANISELLGDSFFMNDGLIGDFAQNKIQEVINQLIVWRDQKKSGELAQQQHQMRNWCVGIISLIADSIVRNKLYEIYWEIFEDHGAIDNEIEMLQSRIKMLKMRKNDIN